MKFSAHAPAIPGDLVVIGKLGTVHGVHGEIKLFSLSDVPGRFDNLQEVWYVGEKGLAQRLEVKSLRAAGTFWLICFLGIETREEALGLINGQIAIPNDRRGVLPEGAYFLDDIIGLEVVDENGRHLGRIVEIFKTGANDIYEIRDQGKELLLPALKSNILEIDLKAHRMRVRIPEGLEA